MKDFEVLTFPRYVGMGVHRQKRSLGFYSCTQGQLLRHQRMVPTCCHSDLIIC